MNTSSDPCNIKPVFLVMTKSHSLGELTQPQLNISTRAYDLSLHTDSISLLTYPPAPHLHYA